MKRLLLAAAFCAAATPSHALFDTAAPGLVQIVDPAAPTAPLGTVSHPLNTTGTFSASVAGFPGGAGGVFGTPVTAVTTVTAGSTQTLPAGTVVVATNIGTTNMAFCQLGATASANSQAIAPNGGWFGFTVGSATQITCVTTAATTTVNTFGGAGLPTGTGGGGGIGGGGTTNITQWASQTVGNPTNYGTAPSGLFPGVNAFITNTVPVTVASLPLPAGAATSALQPAINGDGGALAHVTNFPATQPVSAAALPLPTGAATSALQSTINTTLGSPMQNSGGSVTANLGTLGGAATAANQEVTAAGVTATSAQGMQGVTGGIAMPMSAAALPLPAGAATAANQEVTLAGVTATSAQGVQGVTGGIPIPVAGSFSASIGAFTPDNSYSTPLAVTSTSTAGGTPLPGSATTGSVVKIYNRGPASIFYQLGNASVVATTSNAQLAPGCWDSVVVKVSQTNIAALTIVTGLTATMNVESGTGLPEGSGCTSNPSTFQATGLAGVTWTNIGATDNTGHTTIIESTAPGTAATTDLLGIQGGGTTAAPVAVDTPTTGNNLYSAINAGTGTPGSAAPTQGVMVGGTDGGNFRALSTDTHGNVSVTPYPNSAVPITASATGTTAATTATLTNVAGHTTYICGYSVRANATAATTVLDTITGVITATMSSELWVAPAASGLGVDEQIFSPCIPASAVSVSIAVVSGAPGAGGAVSVRAWGYSL